MQKFVFRDELGNRVQGILWNKDIDLLCDALQPFKTYYIGGAYVQQIKPAFLPISNGLTMQWVLGRSSFILPISDNHKEIPYPQLSLTPFNELPNYMHSQKTIDLLAVVAEVRTPKQRETKAGITQLQELIVVQEEMKPLLLTLWGDFVSHQGTELIALRNNLPTVLCKRLKVTSYADISVSAMASSYVEVNPNIPQAMEVQNWAHNHADAIRAVTNEMNEQSHDQMPPFNPEEEIIPVALLPANIKAAWVKVNITFNHLEQDYYFLACPECSYRTSALDGEEFLCHICKTLRVASPKCKVYAELRDDTGSIKATFFDKNAEKILGLSAAEISIFDEKGIQSIVMDAEKRIVEEEVLAEIKTTKRKYTDGNSRYTVQKWFKKNSVAQIEYGDKQKNGSPTKDLKTFKRCLPTLPKVEPPKTGSSGCNSTSDYTNDCTNGMDQIEKGTSKNSTSSATAASTSVKKLKFKKS